MRLIDEQTAECYLRKSGRIATDDVVCVRELSGGVSNMVVEVQFPGQPARDFVLKQARAQLRTQQAWYASIERIWREADVLNICARLLQPAPGQKEDRADWRAETPRILFEDREQYLFAMTAAPRPNVVWKQQLLAGQVDPQIAATCGQLLGTLHGVSWQNTEVAERLSDCTLFDQLRVDPYYRTLAAAHPEMRGHIMALIDSLAAHPRSLVHADFSPKNLLVFSGGLMMVDFETGHYGDPAFDLGFFLSHLVLKACYHAPQHAAFLALSEVFWREYVATMTRKIPAGELAELRVRGIQHFAGCGWARLEGKSPVEYLTDPVKRNQMRGLCQEIFRAQPTEWTEVTALCQDAFSVQ